MITIRMIYEVSGEVDVVIFTPAQRVITISGKGPRSVIKAYFHHFIPLLAATVWINIKGTKGAR